VNDLTQYAAVRDQIRQGDLIVFWGNEPLSWLIRLFAPGPSHCAVVRHGQHRDYGVRIIESTIENERDGVQTNPLADTLLNYGDGAKAMWLPLSEEARRQIDWSAFYAFCGSTEDHVRYDVEGLFEFLLREVPIVGPRVAQDEHTDNMVCSAWATALWSKCGLLRGFNWSKVKPDDLVEMRLYREAVPILGKPKLCKRFNSL
jgi:hypothetical protein